MSELYKFCDIDFNNGIKVKVIQEKPLVKGQPEVFELVVFKPHKDPVIIENLSRAMLKLRLSKLQNEEIQEY